MAHMQALAAPESGTAALSKTERIDRLRLIRSENVGPATFAGLMARYATASAALEALPRLAAAGGRKRPIKIAKRSDAEREFDAAEKLGARFVFLGEADYPPALARADAAPPVLCVHGHTALVQRPGLAMVGARNASALGRRFAMGLAAELGGEGFTIISGLARGIDTAAHQGALKTGTIAVLAGGIDHIYPQENADLFRAIIEQGCLVSEMPVGFEPQARHFPRRNRLISGLAWGAIVVEAALRSGSLITARYALEQNREVFAVPGNPQDPRARGANDLIRQGATLVESAEDVLRVLSPVMDLPLSEPPRLPLQGDLPFAGAEEPPGEDLARARSVLTELIGFAPVEVDELLRQSGLDAPTVLTVLLELDLAGRLERLTGGRVRLLEDDAP